MTDRERRLIALFFPGAPMGGGRDLRQVANAKFYLLQTGCQWRMMPRDFPPRSTMYG